MKDAKSSIKRLEKLPEGWKPIEGATTAPNGWVWVDNGKSFFDPQHEQGIVREECLVQR